jgi:protein-S-isoprenylcysteine O-methyltransferase Ste14
MSDMYLTCFLIILFIIIAIQRACETFAKREKQKGVIKQKWTFSLLFIAYVIVVIGSIAEYFLIKRNINLIVTLIGIILYVSGLIGRNWCIRSLGKYWSIHVEIRRNHKLIKTGLYRYIRHPAYLSILLEVCGIPLIVNAYIIFLFSLAVHIPLLILRIHYEEKEYPELFGPEYLAYKKETGAFFPRIRRLK